MIINLNLIKFNNYKQNPKKTPAIKNYVQDVFVRSSNISFSGKHCLTNEFEIKNIKNLHCPYCDQIMLNKEQREQFVNEVSNKKGEELVKTLEKYEDERVFTHDEQGPSKSVFRPKKQEVVNAIKEEARKNPDLNLSQIVASKAQVCMSGLIDKQMEVVEELEDYISKNVTLPNEQKKLGYILYDQKEKIYGRGKTEFKRKGFIFAIKNTMSDPIVQQGLDEIVEKLPNSNNNTDSFFVKYGKKPYDSKKIAQALIIDSEPTAEHLIPRNRKSKNVQRGTNDISNYIADCNGCNSNRGNMPFYDWQENNPNFQLNLQAYLNRIQKVLDKENGFVGYDTYIEDVINTIEKLSNGKIRLVQPESTNDSTVQAILLKRKAKIEEKEAKIKENQKITREKKAQIEAIKEQPFFKTIKQLLVTKSKLETLRIQINNMQKGSSFNPKDSNFIRLTTEQSNYQKKLEELEQEIASYSNDGILENKKNTLSKMQSIQGEIDAYKQELKTMASMQEESKILKEENAKLEKLNDRLVYSDVDVEDKTDFNEYCYFVDLRNEAEERLSAEENKKQTKSQKDFIAIIQIALSSINARIASYEIQENVEYFINLETIQENKERIENLEKTIKDPQEIIEKIRDLENKKASISHGKSIEDIQKEIEELNQKKELQALAYQYQSLKSELESLEETDQYNQDILYTLKDKYKTMTNEEFTTKLGELYL